MADRRALSEDLGVLLRAAMQGQQAELWTALPGFVTKFDAAKLTCEVQPTIQARVRGPDGTSAWVNLPLLLDCPVVFPAGGGFTLTFPIKPDDECLVVFASRCIDSWWQSGGINVQSELRMHDLSDGFVIPGPRSKPNVPVAVSTTEVQLRNDDNTAFVSIAPDGSIKATSPVSIALTAPVIMLNGNVVTDGTLDVAGLVTVPELNAPPIGSYIEHVHILGSGFTGPPKPGS